MDLKLIGCVFRYCFILEHVGPISGSPVAEKWQRIVEIGGFCPFSGKLIAQITLTSSMLQIFIGSERILGK